MLKPYHYSAFLLSAIISSNALAGCSSPTFLRADLRTALRNNTICYPGSAEEHRGNGILQDYKTGIRSIRRTVDPRIQIGSWRIINNNPNPAQVEYNYFKGTDSAGPFIFTPHNDGPGLISFCDGGALVQSATIITGIGIGC